MRTFYLSMMIIVGLLFFGCNGQRHDQILTEKMILQKRVDSLELIIKDYSILTSNNKMVIVLPTKKRDLFR
jgi:hypothetical protein